MYHADFGQGVQGFMECQLELAIHFKSIPISWLWSYKYAESITANVGYDIFGFGNGPTASNWQLVIWLGTYGMQPSGSKFGSVRLGHVAFDVYTDEIFKVKTHFFIAKPPQTDFTGDLLDFFDYCVDNLGIDTDYNIYSIRGGTNIYQGLNATFSTSSFSIAPKYKPVPTSSTPPTPSQTGKVEYIDGRSVSPTERKSLTDQQERCLYTSLAEIYIQLRRLTFGSIGCLARSPGSIGIHKALNTIDFNSQELEGMEPALVQDKYVTVSNAMSSANSYAEMLLELADNAFRKSPARIFDEEQGQDALYHLHLFRHFATEEWLDRDADQGPFVLVHGDLRLPNILLNDEMKIISVLDWEWSRVVPLQFFQPPLWLTGFNPPALASEFVYERLMDKFNELVEIIRCLERNSYGDELLSSE
ncbi:concanavalin A-like lectin/glucanase domain-containing protein [Stachybotrys elegans]|uniref:Concanavalin A-like lectin/glucanase domain-containing protein n=1 Tax=Stachybotrys elegans TaxID=80388 RepID=A0A8K0SD11_9HYPO|nr:concanavalin A-like lectin/glucanase domain-containing protein [Stachybotrys elegans]